MQIIHKYKINKTPKLIIYFELLEQFFYFTSNC